MKMYYLIVALFFAALMGCSNDFATAPEGYHEEGAETQEDLAWGEMTKKILATNEAGEYYQWGEMYVVLTDSSYGVFWSETTPYISEVTYCSESPQWILLTYYQESIPVVCAITLYDGRYYVLWTGIGVEIAPAVYDTAGELPSYGPKAVGHRSGSVFEDRGNGAWVGVNPSHLF